MRILVIGGGGREHALVWKLAQSPHVEKYGARPGTAVFRRKPTCITADVGDVDKLVDLAGNLKPDLTIVAPNYLRQRIGDVFAQRRWAIVAPSRHAAQLEGSKIFAKEFLRRHKHRHCNMYGAYDSLKSALAALDSVSWRW